MPIQRSVIDRFVQMHWADWLAVVEVGDGAGDAEDFVVGSGGETEIGHGILEDVLTLVVHAAELTGLTMGHVAVVTGTVAVESGGLGAAGYCHLAAKLLARRAGRSARKIAKRNGRHLDVDVDAVDQRAGDLAHVLFDLGGRAMAVAAGVAAIAAGTGIQRGDQHEVGRKRRAVERAGNGDQAVFEGLTQDFERLPVELGELIEKEDAVVGEGDFAGRRRGTAAHETGVADGVMRGAEGTNGQEGLAGFQAAEGTVDARGFDGFGGGQIGQNSGHSLGQHRLARAGRAEHQQVVTAGGGDGEGAFGGFLAANVGEIDFVGGEIAEEFVEARGLRFDIDFAGEEADGLRETGDGDDVDAFDDGGFGGAGGGDEQAVEFLLLGGSDGHGERAFGGASDAVEGEFADDGVGFEAFGVDLSASGQQAEGDG